MFTPNLPPIRSLILPDPGWVLVDADFDRADAQIVAWSANEPGLKRIFQDGTDIHSANASWINKLSKNNRVSRQQMKAGVHLSNYGGKANTLASTLGVSQADARAFQAYWFGLYPGIPRWHEQTMTALKLQHYIRNVWGFRRFYFERIDESLLPQALAWLGQSGVAIAINHAMLQVRARFARSDLQLRLQVHDSLLLQVRVQLCPDIFPEIIDAMRVLIPFKPEPLFIPVSLKYSPQSWGAVRKWSAAA